MKGPAGYGRYNDDPQHIGCPRAKSDMTPCIARDGDTALSSDRIRNAPEVCVGCNESPAHQIADLATEYAPARQPYPHFPKAAANRFRDLVWEATGGGERS